MDRRSLAVQIAWKMYGLPYVWGGDDTLEGFDCSGMIVEILKSTGDLPSGGDWTAQDLWLRFRGARTTDPIPGCLVFYGTLSRITHVEFCIDDTYSIGASGGGPEVDDLEEAVLHNAFVKVRPFRTRLDLVGFVDPFILDI